MRRCATWRERHVQLAPEGEREEIRQIFHAKGFKGAALDSAVDVITSKRQRWIDTMMTEEHGLPGVRRSPARAAAMTFLAFLLGGSICCCPSSPAHRPPCGTSTLMTGVTFFSIGSLRSHLSPAPWWKAGLETFLIGITAAFVAYLVGVILGGLVSGAG